MEAQISFFPQEEYNSSGDGRENRDADEGGVGELCGNQGVEYAGENARVREQPRP